MAEEKKLAEEPIQLAEEQKENTRELKFRKPYQFEGKEYKSVDLSGMEDLKTTDLLSINRFMEMEGTSFGLGTTPEMTLEYACHVAAKATSLPVEFFRALPAREGLRIKNRVVAFFYGLD